MKTHKTDFDPIHGENDGRQRVDLWFTESEEISHGLKTSIKIKEVLIHTRSKFQEIAILETEKLGKMLVLDGINMLTEFDEFAYHEMIVHVPILTHPDPRKILIIGGGDGGSAREVLKHPEVEEIHVCEIDEEVIKICRKYLPSLASSFDNAKVHIIPEDGTRYVTSKPNTYDVIIVDSSDPVGPAKGLFQQKFYKGMKNALTKEGIAVTQAESLYLHQSLIKGMANFIRDIYPKMAYYNIMVPTYPSGVIGFFSVRSNMVPRGTSLNIVINA